MAEVISRIAPERPRAVAGAVRAVEGRDRLQSFVSHYAVDGTRTSVYEAVSWGVVRTDLALRPGFQVEFSAVTTKNNKSGYATLFSYDGKRTADISQGVYREEPRFKIVGRPLGRGKLKAYMYFTDYDTGKSVHYDDIPLSHVGKVTQITRTADGVQTAELDVLQSLQGARGESRRRLRRRLVSFGHWQ